MFVRLSKLQPAVTLDSLVKLHPSELMGLLELAWDGRLQMATSVPLGHPLHRSDLRGLNTSWLGASLFANTNPPKPQPIVTLQNAASNLQLFFPSLPGSPRGAQGLLWDHLIYAYMVENTRVYEIFRRVIHEFLHGEKLGTPSSTAPTATPASSSDTQRWLRITEELFYRDGAPFFISAITSRVRSDIHAVGRNAYQRMFGMDLNHGTDDNKPYPYTKAEAANTGFVLTFEEFLREVWIGIENVNNNSGPRPADDAKIADLATKLCDMLLTRRQGGNHSREEFELVCRMSWFHLTLNDNFHPIIRDLRAEASSPEERLFKIAQRVGLPAHGLSRSYFDIADSISRILIAIEMGAFNTPGAAEALYKFAPGGPEEHMKTIIRHWSIITGREMKARRVAAS